MRHTPRISRSGLNDLWTHSSSFAPITVGVVLILCLFMSLWMLSRTVKRLANIGNWTLKDGLKIAPQSPWLPILARFSRFCIYATLMIL